MLDPIDPKMDNIDLTSLTEKQMPFCLYIILHKKIQQYNKTHGISKRKKQKKDQDKRQTKVYHV
jgi:hypothetical protein